MPLNFVLFHPVLDKIQKQNRKSVDREHGRGSTDREYNNSRESLESKGWDSRDLATVVAGQEAVLARLEMKLERIIGQVGMNALTWVVGSINT